MRFFSILIFIAGIFGALSALALPVYNRNAVAASDDKSGSIAISRVTAPQRRELDSETDLFEAREPKGQTPKVVFSNGARKHLDSLGLHGKARKRAKTWHRNVVKNEMKQRGATSARIVHLAHTQGSVDPKLHVTGNLWNGKKAMKNTYNRGNLHHMYVGNRKVSNTYQAAVHRAGKKL